MPREPWADSDRRERLPANWAALRRVVIDRAGGQCEAVKSNGRRCPNPGRDVDHVVRNGPDDPSAMQLLCVWHHRAKTAEEGHEAAAANRAKTRRPGRRHPGMK